ncbi:hypothetical protein RJT34_12173 [Clitoria ternatea]|uniref:Uncharacterized protein n=1 Tax=Clitoria ternatea TaxID=43366 RepID=A0AAN9JNY7_CLITE
MSIATVQAFDLVSNSFSTFLARKTKGNGRSSWPLGATYEVEFKNGFMDGTGLYIGFNGDTYKGQWIMNLKHGHGFKSYANGGWYDGAWRMDLQDGIGREGFGFAITKEACSLEVYKDDGDSDDDGNSTYVVSDEFRDDSSNLDSGDSSRHSREIYFENPPSWDNQQN